MPNLLSNTPDPHNADEPANVEQDWDKEDIGCPEEVANQLYPVIKEINYYLLQVETGIQHIYMHAKLELPPPLSNEELDAWLDRKFGTLLPPKADENIAIAMKPKDYVSPIETWDKSQILDTYFLKGSPPYSITHYPIWLTNIKPIDKIDRFIVIGHLTEYGHLVPIKEHHLE